MFIIAQKMSLLAKKTPMWENKYIVWAILLLVFYIFIAPRAFGSEANVGDFGTNQQAETITTTTETTVNQEGMPVTTAVAPSTPTYQTDTCIVTSGAGMQTLQIGISASKMKVDQNCERLKLSRQLEKLGLKVAATSILCQDARVWWAMRNAQTPCPIKGLIGDEALDFYKENPSFVPDAPAVHKDDCERKRLRYDSVKRKHVYDKQCNNK
jgi:hypothetical protein